MKKWGLILMLVAMLATPMLACGFPLPAGTGTMQVTKTVCAEGEPADSCQARQDAYQLMSQLQSAVIPDLEMSMLLDTPDGKTEIHIKGSFEYQLVASNEGVGANVHAVIDEGTMTDASGTQSLSGAELIVIGTTGYSSEDGGKTWTSEEMDSTTLLGLLAILGLTGAEGAAFDLYSDPAIFTVTPGTDVEYENQTMKVQTLELNLTALLSTAPALTALMESGFAAGGESLGVSADSLGMAPEEFAAVAAMLLPFLQGTSATTTLHIGADDGYIHFVNDNLVFAMDMTSMDPESGKMNFTYAVSGHITQHNEPLVITAPSGATEGTLFGDADGLFGSGGLGGSLFGQ